MEHSTKSFREALGVIVSAIIVLCFIGLGFVQVAVMLFLDKNISFDSDWKISIYGLANIAFGYLIGSKLTGGTPGTQSPVVENAENVNVAGPSARPPVARPDPNPKPAPPRV